MNTLNQSAYPTAWKINYVRDGVPRTVLCGHNSVADYRDIDPDATSTPIYTPPQTALATDAPDFSMSMFASRTDYDAAMQARTITPSFQTTRDVKFGGRYKQHLSVKPCAQCVQAQPVPGDVRMVLVHALVASKGWTHDYAIAFVDDYTSSGQPVETTPWQPEFDATSLEQEQLVIQFCMEIAGPKGKPGSPPDPVRLLEMAEALYTAERKSFCNDAPLGKLPDAEH